jgi:acyl carrier protein
MRPGKPPPEPATGHERDAGDPALITREVAGVWCDVLGVHSVGDDDDFFALGANSLLATHVLRIVEERFGSPVDLHDFYAEPTVAGLVRLIASSRTGNRREKFEV